MYYLEEFRRSSLVLVSLCDPQLHTCTCMQASRSRWRFKCDEKESKTYCSWGYSLQVFQATGFQKNFNFKSVLPGINYGAIWWYMIEMCHARRQLSTAKPLVKGLNFFKSGHVLSIKCQKLNDHFCIKSQVLPSMKKTKPYGCFIVILHLAK